MSGPAGASLSGAPASSLLAPHARAAILGARAIVLDLRRDRYLMTDAGALSVLVAQPHTPSRLREELRARALLKDDGDEAAPCRAALPWGPDVMRFWLSALWARRVMRARALACAIARLEQAPALPNASAIGDAVAAFSAWRPWYPRPNKCLFDALALGAFLRSRNWQVEIRFGVQLDPFAAHCWVEHAGAIAGDDPEYCAAFTPLERL